MHRHKSIMVVKTSHPGFEHCIFLIVAHAYGREPSWVLDRLQCRKPEHLLLFLSCWWWGGKGICSSICSFSSCHIVFYTWKIKWGILDLLSIISQQESQWDTLCITENEVHSYTVEGKMHDTKYKKEHSRQTEKEKEYMSIHYNYKGEHIKH